MTGKTTRARKPAPIAEDGDTMVTLRHVPPDLLGPQFRRGMRIRVNAILRARLEEAEAVDDAQPAL
ncbi:hypothetical protein [Sphingobium cloacae]|uniref:hypothetical protein n=1 Tax=Sphingobium cloacae TaxID=120107 RepID=UPI0008354577|nr:hypothetical protein [Sphingobium cloacae]